MDRDTTGHAHPVERAVPSQTVRRDIMGIVDCQLSQPRNRGSLAAGAWRAAHDTWMGGVGFGIKQLAQLKSGQVDLEATTLSVSGEALICEPTATSRQH